MGMPNCFLYGYALINCNACFEGSIVVTRWLCLCVKSLFEGLDYNMLRNKRNCKISGKMVENAVKRSAAERTLKNPRYYYMAGNKENCCQWRRCKFLKVRRVSKNCGENSVMDYLLVLGL